MTNEASPKIKIEGMDFIVKRDDWHRTRFTRAAVDADLHPNQVLLRVDRFGLTANNITYAVAGDLMGYWQFFPTNEVGWGRLPVMGLAEVIHSGHPDIPAGSRVFGYLPMSTHVVVQADQVSDHRFVDGSSQRAGGTVTEREFTRISATSGFDVDHPDEYMLLWGLFVTAFAIEDFLRENKFFGGETCLITSASSKTSLALAHQLSPRWHGAVLGLTSGRHRRFVESTRLYDQVVTYDDIDRLPRDPAVLVDLAGDADVVAAVNTRLRNRLKYNCFVGATHWQAQLPVAIPEMPPPVLFFAPPWMETLIKNWGVEEFQRRTSAAWTSFLNSAKMWLTITRGYGPDAVEEVYLEVLSGLTPPSLGHVLSLWQE